MPTCRYARLDWLNKPAGIVMIAALLTVPLVSALAAILAIWLDGGRWLTLLRWLLIPTIASVLLIVPAIPLIGRSFRAGIDALPAGEQIAPNRAIVTGIRSGGEWGVRSVVIIGVRSVWQAAAAPR